MFSCQYTVMFLYCLMFSCQYTFMFSCQFIKINLFKVDSQIFFFGLQHLGSPLSRRQLVSHFFTRPLFVLNLLLKLTNAVLITFHILLSINIGLVGMIQGNFEVLKLKIFIFSSLLFSCIDISFHLFLNSHQLGSASRLGFQASLHGFQGTLVILTSVFELFFFFL
jgi:hypothetical protein